MTRPASSCSTLVPEDWKDGVAGVAQPSRASAGDWIAFGDAQTGRLDLANDHTRNAIGIVQACEKRDAETVKSLTRPWYAFWR